MKRRLIAGLIAFILPIHMIVLADGVWNYENGVLTIMSNTQDFEKSSQRPWDKYKNDVSKIVIKDGVTSIGDWSFANFSKLKEVQFAPSVDEIGERAFYNCSSISYINLNEGLKTIENGAFNSCKGAIRVKLPDSLESIGDSAFMNLPEVPVITIPESVKNVGMWAFMGCTSLEQIYIEGDVTKGLGNSCFASIHENYILYYNVKYREVWKLIADANEKHMVGYDPSERIPVYINNKELCFDVDPIIVNGRTLVPMRDVFENLGAVVTWNGEYETATAEKGDITVVVQIGSDTMRKNNQIISLEAPARIHINRTLVPARAVSEAFGAKVSWNEKERAVYIQID